MKKTRKENIQISSNVDEININRLTIRFAWFISKGCLSDTDDITVVSVCREIHKQMQMTALTSN